MISNQIKTCCFLFLVFLSSTLHASILPSQNESPYHHLVEINSEWEHHKDALPALHEIKFKSDVDRIQYHLHHVIAYLSSHDLPASNKAKQNRLNLLSELRRYADKKVFPTNLYHTQRTPYFIDDYGVHCAVGYMIKVSGHSHLSNQISQEHNYDYLRDIKTPGVQEWAKKFGFTLDELAWIQPGYSPQLIISSIFKANDDVYGSLVDTSLNSIISFGHFDSINEEPINGLVVTTDKTQYEFSQDFHGDVNDGDGDMNDLVVCGSLYKDADTLPLGYYNGLNWRYYTSPNPNLKHAVKVHRIDKDAVMLVLSDKDSGISDSEIWIFDLRNATAYKNVKFRGIINVIERTPFGTMLGGHMFNIKVFNSQGTSDLAHSLMLSYNQGSYSQVISSFNGVIEASSVLAVDSGMYIGTKSDKINDGVKDIPQLIFYNTKQKLLNVLITRDDFALNSPGPMKPQDISISSLSLYRERHLMLGGQFTFVNGMMETGNLIRYDIKKRQIGLSIGPSSIHSMDYLSDSLLYVTYVKGMVQFGHPVSVTELNEQTITISPNPFTSHISISGIEAKEFKFELLDLSGRVIQSGVTQTSSITLDDKVSSGVYSLSLEADGRYHTYKVMKE